MMLEGETSELIPSFLPRPSPSVTFTPPHTHTHTRVGENGSSSARKDPPSPPPPQSPLSYPNAAGPDPLPTGPFGRRSACRDPNETKIKNALGGNIIIIHVAQHQTHAPCLFRSTSNTIPLHAPVKHHSTHCDATVGNTEAEYSPPKDGEKILSHFCVSEPWRQ